MTTPTLQGRILFITGASRGIGKAIALRAARDGATIVVAAKTTEAHPALPGTIHTAAAEIEAAGGKALAVPTDIRFKDQVHAAVAKAIERFGGIDIVINNASAIFLAGTLAIVGLGVAVKDVFPGALPCNSKSLATDANGTAPIDQYNSCFES